jgi:hypothetical protein
VVVADARVDDGDLRVESLERHHARRQVRRIDEQRAALLTEAAHELVHESRVRSDKSVLGFVRRDRDLAVVDVEREHLTQRARGRDSERGTRRETGADRHVRSHGRVEARNTMAPTDQRIDDPEHVIGPIAARCEHVDRRSNARHPCGVRSKRDRSIGSAAQRHDGALRNERR